MSEAQVVIDHTRQAIHDRKGQWNRIARDTGLSFGWVRKFAVGQVENPGVLTLEKVRHWLASQEQKGSAS